MKVLFVYPNDYLEIGIPIGIAILSAVLKERGHQVDLFDFTFIKEKEEKGISENYNRGFFLPTEYTIDDLAANDPVTSIEEEFREKINAFQPDLIAVSAMTGNFDQLVDLLKKVKTSAKVIVGGVHTTIFPNDALSFDFVDFICVGEGEETFPELCECLEKNGDYAKIENLGYKKNGEIHINKCRPFVNMDSLPTPDWSIFDERHLFRPFMGKIYRGSFYTLSRGCVFDCSYCVNRSMRNVLKECGRYFRFQSAATTVKQIKSLKEKYNATWFKLADDSITLFPDAYLEELAEGLKSLDIKFGCSVRPETVTARKVELLKSMGCVAASIGVESGSQELRRMVLNRRMTNEQIAEAVGLLKGAGIRVSTFNMIGLPGETREDVFETIKLNRRLNVESVNVYILYPYPGTGIYEKYKINIRDKEGNIIPISEASSFSLSKMPPSEVDGLLKTFDLYLKLPEEKWPLIKEAETNSEIAESLFNSISALAR